MDDLEKLLQLSIEIEKDKKYLADRQKKLADQTLELNNKIQEAKRAKELEKIQLIIIESVTLGRITVDTNGTPRIDVLDLLRATPSRQYYAIKQRNVIEIRYWNNFKEHLEKLPNIELKYLKENEEFLNKYFTEKMWSISMNEKSIIIKKAERNLDTYRVQKIPSALYSTQMKHFTAPFSEAWRIIQVFPLGDDVEYSPNVLELAEKQINQRKKMDEVALNNNAELPNPFINGWELKPFQKAGVYFMMTALDLEVPEVKK